MAAARRALPFVPFDRWPNAAESLRLDVPAMLRSYKSDGRYNNPALPGGEWLIWAEPVGSNLLVVFRDVRPGACVALVDAAGALLRWQYIPALAAPARARDAYAWAARVAIRSAQHAVAVVRERTVVVGTPSEDEAWLRRQLEGLE
jgi:hypothetical protein